MYLNFVCKLLDLVDGGVVLVGELPELLLAALRHFLQVGALIFRVAQRALAGEKKKTINTAARRRRPQLALATGSTYLHLGQLPDHLDLLLQDPLQRLLCRRLVVVLVLLQGEQLLADAFFCLGLREWSLVGVRDYWQFILATLAAKTLWVTLEYACS